MHFLFNLHTYRYRGHESISHIILTISSPLRGKKKKPQDPEAKWKTAISNKDPLPVKHSSILSIHPSLHHGNQYTVLPPGDFR